MAGKRAQATVDEGLHKEARQAHPDLGDAALIDATPSALIAKDRRAQIDESGHPMETKTMRPRG